MNSRSPHNPFIFMIAAGDTCSIVIGSTFAATPTITRIMSPSASNSDSTVNSSFVVTIFSISDYGMVRILSVSLGDTCICKYTIL